jgi:hypothetical protein
MPALAFLVFWLAALTAATIVIVVTWRFAKALAHDVWFVRVRRHPGARQRLPLVLGGRRRRSGLLTLTLLLLLLGALLVAMRVITHLGGI